MLKGGGVIFAKELCENINPERRCGSGTSHDVFFSQSRFAEAILRKDITPKAEWRKRNLAKTFPLEQSCRSGISGRAELQKRYFVRHSLKVTKLSR